MPRMRISSAQTSQLILAELADGERRMLSLIVSIRKAMTSSGVVKGDASTMVRSALRSLVTSGAIIEVDGMYSLAPTEKLLAT